MDSERRLKAGDESILWLIRAGVMIVGSGGPG
jgi:hypothetical protein